VNSRTTERFRRAFDQLPERIRQRARLAYQLFREDPHHPSLRFSKTEVKPRLDERLVLRG
jgi:hypothetical protein